MADTILEVKNLSLDYLPNNPKEQAAKAFEDVSFKLYQSDILAVVGESGCGKTTLMLSLMRLLPANARIRQGEIYLSGKDLLKLSEAELNKLRWAELAIVFQGAMNALNPVRSVGDQIGEALLKHGMAKKEIHGRIGELLELVGIAQNRQHDYPHQYSGGMRQRAMIAMALACNPKVIIADEPTTALDVMVQAQILELFLSLRDKLGLSIILVTHDLGVVAEIADRVMVMYAGTVAEMGDSDSLFNQPKHPYSQELLKAFPDINDPKRKLVSISGYPPKLNNLPPGCRFAPRCRQALDICHQESPKAVSISEDHVASCWLLGKAKNVR
ncbi:MAG: ABC transporter ATP-binding protein [Deinococcales bacterium]